MGLQPNNHDPSIPSSIDTTTFKITPFIIFVLGGPGAGKGTQCSKLVQAYDFVHLSAGDLLREERNRPDSKVGELINDYIKEGLIVPKEITIELLRKAMFESRKSRFLIDGFPRKIDQAEAFEATVAPSNFILYLSCEEEVMEQRLLKRAETSGRVDDNVDSIRKRFLTFRDTSLPVIEKYRQLHPDKVYEVPCHGSTEEVYQHIQNILKSLGLSKVVQPNDLVKSNHLNGFS